MMAVIAIIVIGPKDLPKAMRTVGQLVRRARSTVREFQNSVDDMVRESELEDLRKSAKEITDLSPQNQIAKWTDPTGFENGGEDGKDDKRMTPTGVPFEATPPTPAPAPGAAAETSGAAPGDAAAATPAAAPEAPQADPGSGGGGDEPGRPAREASA